MSQNTTILPTTGTVSGLQMTQATNNALDTLNTLALGASAPSSPAAGQLWHDTTNNLLKLRSLDNSAWITLFALNETAYQAAGVSQAGASGFINRVLNGGMAIDQMNEGSSYSVASSNTPIYTADQWVAACNSGTASSITVQRVTDAPAGFTNSLKLTVGTGASTVSSGDFLALWQPIEASHISDLAFGTGSAATLSLSFWVKASVAGTYAVALQNHNASRSCVVKFTVSSTGSWQQITLPAIPCDSSGTWASGATLGMNLYFIVGTGSTYQTSSFSAWQSGAYLGATTHSNTLFATSGATFQVTGVMLNAGVFALPIERRSLEQEFELCQRYFFKTFPQGTAVAAAAGAAGSLVTIQGYNGAAGNQSSVDLPFPVSMRATPTITTYNPITSSSAQFRNVTRSIDASSIATSFASTRNCAFTFTTGVETSVGDANSVHVTASARM